MSKKKFNSAIEAIINSDEKTAIKILESLDPQYVKKRLNTSVNEGTTTSEQANHLWNESLHNKELISFPCKKYANLKAESPIEKDEDTSTYSPPTPSRKIDLSAPEEFLSWLAAHASNGNTTVTLDDFDMIQPWGLVALTALARSDGDSPISIQNNRVNNAGKFSAALGVLDIVNAREPSGKGKKGRTVKMRRIKDFTKIEKVAFDISHLIVDNVNRSEYIDHEETRRVVYYVLVELMRNIIQHSGDPLGGVIVAQSMNVGGLYDKSPSIQVAVADHGIGIYQALKGMHSEIEDPGTALERSLWPHYSGTFDDTKKGSAQNAGLGLFFISEIAKLSGGRLLIASQGDALYLTGDETGHGSIRLLGSYYPGTLVVFEIPKRGIADFGELQRSIISLAEERTTERHDRELLRFNLAPNDAIEISIKIGAEDTTVAEKLSREFLVPKLKKKEHIVLNFANIDLCTQSYIHALLYDALRVAWEMGMPIYIKKATEPVRDNLRLVQMYALSDVEQIKV